MNQTYIMGINSTAQTPYTNYSSIIERNPYFREDIVYFGSPAEQDIITEGNFRWLAHYINAHVIVLDTSQILPESQVSNPIAEHPPMSEDLGKKVLSSAFRLVEDVFNCVSIREIVDRIQNLLRNKVINLRFGYNPTIVSYLDPQGNENIEINAIYKRIPETHRALSLTFMDIEQTLDWQSPFMRLRHNAGDGKISLFKWMEEHASFNQQNIIKVKDLFQRCSASWLAPSEEEKEITYQGLEEQSRVPREGYLIYLLDRKLLRRQVDDWNLNFKGIYCQHAKQGDFSCNGLFKNGLLDDDLDQWFRIVREEKNIHSISLSRELNTFFDRRCPHSTSFQSCVNTIFNRA